MLFRSNHQPTDDPFLLLDTGGWTIWDPRAVYQEQHPSSTRTKSNKRPWLFQHWRTRSCSVCSSWGSSWSPCWGRQCETWGLDFQEVGGLAPAENKTHLSFHNSTHLERFKPDCLVNWLFPQHHRVYQSPPAIPSPLKYFWFFDHFIQFKMSHWLLSLLSQISPTFGPHKIEDNPSITYQKRRMWNGPHHSALTLIFPPASHYFANKTLFLTPHFDIFDICHKTQVTHICLLVKWVILQRPTPYH